MNIYDLWPDTDQFDALNYKHITDITTGHEFTGAALGPKWTPKEVTYFDLRLKGDYPGLLAGIPPVFTEKSLRILLPNIEKDVEVLPLLCETEPLYAINVTTVIDCLNLERSKYTKLEEEQKIIYIEKYDFHKEQLTNKTIFRLHSHISNRVYVLDSFKKIVEDNGLKGFRFIQVA